MILYFILCQEVNHYVVAQSLVSFILSQTKRKWNYAQMPLAVINS